MTDNDSVDFWIEEEKMKVKGGEQIIKASILYKYYKDFCQDGSIRPLGITNFYKNLVMKGFEKKRPNGYRGFKGFKKPANAPEDSILT